jgi:hypothetical protein
MAHWKFRGQRSFGSIRCRENRSSRRGDYKNTHFSFRTGTKRILCSDLHCCFHLLCETAKSCWQTVLDSYWRCCGKALWTQQLVWHSQIVRYSKRFMALIHTRGAAIKATLSVNPSVCPSNYTHSTKPPLLLTMIQHVIQQTGKSFLNVLFLTSLLHVSSTNSWLLDIYCAVIGPDTVSSVSWSDFHKRSYYRINEKTAFQFSFRTRNFHESFTRRQPRTSLRTSVRVPALYKCVIPMALCCGSVAGTRKDTRTIRDKIFR